MFLLEQVLVGVAAVVHCYIFVLESLLWGRPGTNKVFGLTEAAAQQSRLFAFNQGFYNLFLALAAGVGIGLELVSSGSTGMTLKLYACLSMVGAAGVLLYSQPSLLRAVLIQGAVPLVAVVLIVLRLLS